MSETTDPDVLSLEEQTAIVGQIIALARTLERGCDPLLDGHCLHLRERAEAIALILETATDPAS